MHNLELEQTLDQLKANNKPQVDRIDRNQRGWFIFN